MLERLLLPDDHAISILMKDHDRVKDLFDKFEKSKSSAEKEKLMREAIEELKIHAAIEEEIFYPAVRKHVGGEIMNEADEEHHVARVLIAELDRDGKGDDHREAKFTVLSESIRHHIKEEEGEMLPKAKEVDLDFKALGQEMMARKKELKREGVPADAEHAMVSKYGGSDDTPAKTAQATRPTVRKTTKPKAARRPAKTGRAGSH